mgnify:CR=1 FL=1
MDNKIMANHYRNEVSTPWGRLFYRLVWNHLDLNGMKILDFGSGLGVSADHFAKANEVIAVEPDDEMIQHRLTSHVYQQLYGSLDCLDEIPESSIDVVLCHNVLEYMEERESLFDQFHRVLKPDGFISVVKHNRNGTIMQRAVFDYATDEAMMLLDQGEIVSRHFGRINDYELQAMERFACAFEIMDIYGVRMFYGLQQNAIKQEKDWEENMFALECRAEQIPALRDIAIYHHVILRKK